MIPNECSNPSFHAPMFPREESTCMKPRWNLSSFLVPDSNAPTSTTLNDRRRPPHMLALALFDELHGLAPLAPLVEAAAQQASGGSGGGVSPGPLNAASPTSVLQDLAAKSAALELQVGCCVARERKCATNRAAAAHASRRLLYMYTHKISLLVISFLWIAMNTAQEAVLAARGEALEAKAAALRLKEEALGILDSARREAAGGPRAIGRS